MDSRPPTDPAVAQTIARAQSDVAQNNAASPDAPRDSQAVDPSVSAAVADAQRQAAPRQQQQQPALPGPQTLGQLIDARDDVRAKYNAVKGLVQYAKEEAELKARLDELERSIAGRA